MVNVITSYYDNSSSILTGAPRLSLTKYFRDRFWQVSLTKIRKTCMQSCAIDLRPVLGVVLQKG